MSHTIKGKFLVLKAKLGEKEVMVMCGIADIPQGVNIEERGEMWCGPIEIPFHMAKLTNDDHMNVSPENFIRNFSVRDPNNWTASGSVGAPNI